MSVKYFTISVRLLTQYILYAQIKEQSPEFRQFCRGGPHNLIAEEFSLRLTLAVFLPYLLHFYRKLVVGRIQSWLNILQKLSVRLILLLVLKIVCFTNYESFGVFGMFGLLTLELLLVVLAIGIDQFHFYAGEAAELLIIDLLAVLLYTLELTRTFCFQYGLFYLHFNLLVLCMAIVEGFAYRIGRVASIFTKQDGYRVLMLTAIYLVVFGVSNFYHGNNKYAIAVFLPYPLFILGMRSFKNHNFQTAVLFVWGYTILATGLPYYVLQ